MEGIVNSVLEKKIAEINEGSNAYEIGTVSMVRQYIVEVTGLLNVSYFEKVIIGTSAEGYVDAIRESSVLVSLTVIYHAVKIGDSVMATGEEYQAKYSQSATGHVMSIFGEDLMVGKMLDDLEDVPIEMEPIPIMDRTAVNRPLLTGIMGVDLMYPIGRGQRQLIIGDKKTGKTQIALDTIYNQRGKGVFCIYVAIGKTKKEVKAVYSEFLGKGVMDYTLILAAFNDNPAPVLRNTPYAALSIARKHLEKGEDVLVVIDDLKRHADVCREIALLMGSTPGRDAYPPDIFYSHSRLLEMGCQHMNGGSITILPICETKSGDITDYISTNIISITDGQLVLSAKNFEKGQKPAINYGLSVSRLGGAVQTREVKRLGQPLKRELLSYLEQKEIFELADLDEMGESLKNRMRRGGQIINMLNQGRYAVRTSEQMIEEVREFGEIAE